MATTDPICKCKEQKSDLIKPPSAKSSSEKPPSAKSSSAKPPSAKPPSAKPPSAKPFSAKVIKMKPKKKLGSPTPKKLNYDRWADNKRLQIIAAPKKGPRDGRFKDELDLVLHTCYEHNEEIFPDKTDIYLMTDTIQSVKSQQQPKLQKLQKRQQQEDKETRAPKVASHKLPVSEPPPKPTFIKLTRQDIIKRAKVFLPGEVDREVIRTDRFPIRYIEDYPLIIGGFTEHIHPSSIKLMNSSHHSPQTNAGYVRQDRDGNVFQY